MPGSKVTRRIKSEFKNANYMYYIHVCMYVHVYNIPVPVRRASVIFFPPLRSLATTRAPLKIAVDNLCAADLDHFRNRRVTNRRSNGASTLE